MLLRLLCLMCICLCTHTNNHKLITQKQMQELKERAKQHLEDILASVTPGRFSNYGGSSSSSSSSYGGGSVDTQQLRGRLENAIRVMQTGLVERDTEVRLFEGEECGRLLTCLWLEVTLQDSQAGRV
jgi:hypothetical protein